MSAKKPMPKKLVPANTAPPAVPMTLLRDVRALIEQARSATARAVNSALVLLYWQIGSRIRTEVLKGTRADYGEQIVSTLSRQLAAEYGDGYSRPNLFRMTRFAEVFPNQQIVATLSRQLGWSPSIASSAVSWPSI